MYLEHENNLLFYCFKVSSPLSFLSLLQFSPINTATAAKQEKANAFQWRGIWCAVCIGGTWDFLAISHIKARPGQHA